MLSRLKNQGGSIALRPVFLVGIMSGFAAFGESKKTMDSSLQSLGRARLAGGTGGPHGRALEYLAVADRQKLRCDKPVESCCPQTRAAPGP